MCFRFSSTVLGTNALSAFHLYILYWLQTVPAPSDYFVSSWADDPWAGMSYSYMAAGSSGSDYEHLAEPVLNRVMFAGEVRGVLYLSAKRQQSPNFTEALYH